VNRTWSVNALPWIQKKLDKDVKLEINHVYDDFKDANVFIFPSLKFNLNGLSWVVCSNFFTKHGSNIWSMEINESPRGNVHGFLLSAKENMKKLRHILKSVPNLKKLTLCFDWIPLSDPGKFIFNEQELLETTLPLVEHLQLDFSNPLSPGFLDGLFTLLPNVKTIAIGDGAEYTNQNWELFAISMKKLRIRAILQPHPNSEDRVPAGLWRALTALEGAPKLEELAMNIGIVPEEVKYLDLVQAQQDYINSQADNLEILSLEFGKCTELDENTPKFELPLLKNLKQAVFSSAEWPSSYGNYSLIPMEPDRMPNLRTLYFDPELMEANYEVFANAEFTTVEEVHLGKWNNNQNPNGIFILPEIGARFPNLRKITNLETSLDSNVMASIVLNLGNIEELELKILEHRGQMKSINLVISGVPIESAWALTQFGERLGYAALPSFIDPPGASLRDLKRN